MAEKQKDFSIWAKTSVYSLVTIKAKDLEDALTKSKEMKDTDFVEVLGEYMDGDFKVTGVMET
jgi:hypothetical protein